jgi:hypothetical protein
VELLVSRHYTGAWFRKKILKGGWEYCLEMVRVGRTPTVSERCSPGTLARRPDTSNRRAHFLQPGGQVGHRGVPPAGLQSDPRPALPTSR